MGYSLFHLFDPKPKDLNSLPYPAHYVYDKLFETRPDQFQNSRGYPIAIETVAIGALVEQLKGGARKQAR